MPSVRPGPTRRPIAVLCADLHLSLTPPPARAGEKNWVEAMARPLREINIAATNANVPVICAGDVFDRWNAPVELVNIAAGLMPSTRIFSIPGQHDLPLHNLSDLKRSAYWTLCMMGALHDRCAGDGCITTSLKNGVCLHFSAWGSEIPPTPQDEQMHILITHRYVWAEGASYPGADESGHIKSLSKTLKGYAVAVFGDNHKGFTSTTPDGTVVFNCGGMMRRKSDEADYRPGYGMLFSDGTVERRYFDTSKDVFTPVTESSPLLATGSFDKFLSSLSELQTAVPDFPTVLRRLSERSTIPDGVRKVIQEVLENA